MTFHWATNYGAILQAFALQKYLSDKGNEVYIINYFPKKYEKNIKKAILSINIWNLKSRIIEYNKEKALNIFRKKYLRLTRRYNGLIELQNNPPKCEMYVCGSDQIWNPYFTLNGEEGLTSSYYLNFGKDNLIRVAYSISFGCEIYPDKALEYAKKYVGRFNKISVREDSGISIANKMGAKDVIKLLDPTLLINRNIYRKMLLNRKLKCGEVFVYYLRKENLLLKKIEKYFKSNYKINFENKNIFSYSIEKWLSSIAYSSLVVTNSYHGMIFSIIFHVPFIIIVADAQGKEMNDRFYSLLGYLNLNNRIINKFNLDQIKAIEEENINWEIIDLLIEKAIKKTDLFFQNII